MLGKPMKTVRAEGVKSSDRLDTFAMRAKKLWNKYPMYLHAACIAIMDFYIWEVHIAECWIAKIDIAELALWKIHIGKLCLVKADIREGRSG